MDIKIRPPHITGTTERERLDQLERYLFSLAQDLQIVFDNMDSGSNANTAAEHVPQSRKKIT